MSSRSLFFYLCILTTFLVMTGCGGSQKSVTPTPENPYAEFKVGTDSTLEVVTWNLENFAKVGVTTVDHVVEIIEGLDADVIALQEIESSSYFQRLVSNLEGWSGYRAGGSSGWMELAYLYRDEGSFQVTTIYEILTNESRPFPRRPLVLECALNGETYAIINNHLKCCGDGDLDPDDDGDEETRRRDACVLLADYARDHLAEVNVIMVGDWNDELSDSEANNVFQVFLDDTQNWKFVDLPIAQNNNTIWSFPGWPSHLDHILINAALFPDFDAPEAMVEVIPLHTRFEGGLQALDAEVSDHLPVAVRLMPR
jgi:endonuclease/exonuclease/phosphatase family metal-dependent hydrolase